MSIFFWLGDYPIPLPMGGYPPPTSRTNLSNKYIINFNFWGKVFKQYSYSTQTDAYPPNQFFHNPKNGKPKKNFTK